MTFQDIKVKLKDNPPLKIAYTNTIYTYMCKTPTDLQDIMKDALAEVGPRWDSPGYRPVFNIDDKGKLFWLVWP
jgi:hypothetical protein